MPPEDEYLDEHVECRREIERLEQWVADCQSGMYINCVYCGHRYGPQDEVPASMADVLKEHVEQCPQHPMSALKVANARLQAELDALRDKLPTTADGVPVVPGMEVFWTGPMDGEIVRREVIGLAIDGSIPDTAPTLWGLKFRDGGTGFACQCADTREAAEAARAGGAGRMSRHEAGEPLHEIEEE